MKLSYNTVFNRYAMSYSDQLAEIFYSFYKRLRLWLAKIIPTSVHEKYMFEVDAFSQKESTTMPQGFDYIKNQNADGFVTLDYIDLYDYLPKEELSKFVKELKKCMRRNKRMPFKTFYSRKRINELNDFGQYYDGRAFSYIISVRFCKNKELQKYCSSLSISLYNLSTTFLMIKYRVYITRKFNEKFKKICKEKYLGYTSVIRGLNTPCYAVKKFGGTLHTGDDVRQKKIYELISRLKWQVLKEIRKTFCVHFWDNKIFPPTFETYSTNIRPSNEMNNLDFWDSISFDCVTDYAPTYNACVCWSYKNSHYEGERLAAYCGGDYSVDDHLPEIVHDDISDIYGVYLTASTLSTVAERDIAICNKKISYTIQKTKTSSILKVRVSVERMLYYSYRFISEFSGRSMDSDDAKEFQHQFYKDGSISSRSLEYVVNRTKESKQQIDNILKLLNDAAEYRSSESNIKLQWGMMIITILSLVIALFNINETMLDNAIECIFEWLKCIIMLI